MKVHILLRLCLLQAFALGLTECIQAEPTPSRDFSAKELLIDVSVLPKGWYMSYPPQPASLKLGQWESGFVHFDVPSPTLYGTQHTVLRYHRRPAAAAEYREQAKSEFGVALLVTPWHSPPELEYHSSVADQFRFACADVRIYDVQTTCIAMGQYDEYISIFSTHLDPSFMTYANVERILKNIDERMARYLSKIITPKTSLP